MEQDTICKQKHFQTMSDWFFEICNCPLLDLLALHSSYEIGRRQLLSNAREMRNCFGNRRTMNSCSLLDSFSQELLHFLTLRLFKNLALGQLRTRMPHCMQEGHAYNEPVA